MAATDKYSCDSGPHAQTQQELGHLPSVGRAKYMINRGLNLCFKHTSVTV